MSRKKNYGQCFPSEHPLFPQECLYDVLDWNKSSGQKLVFRQPRNKTSSSEYLKSIVIIGAQI